jgi:hypothetical protein
MRKYKVYYKDIIYTVHANGHRFVQDRVEFLKNEEAVAAFFYDDFHGFIIEEYGEVPEQEEEEKP